MIIVPTAVTQLYDVAEAGQVYEFVEFTFDVPVHLVGLPAYTYTDQHGNKHKATSAAPHISNPENYRNNFHVRFGTVPVFLNINPELPSPAITIPADDPHVLGPGGETVYSGTYDVEPLTPPPPH